jgi:hypothetical protein
MRSFATIVFRILGALLGVTSVVIGVLALLYFDEVRMLSRVAGGISMILSGVYFVNYGFTGRRYLLKRPPS